MGDEPKLTGGVTRMLSTALSQIAGHIGTIINAIGLTLGGLL